MTTIADFRAHALVKCTERTSLNALSVYESCYRRHWSSCLMLKYFLAKRLTQLSEALKNPNNDSSTILRGTEYFNAYLDLWNYLMRT